MACPVHDTKVTPHMHCFGSPAPQQGSTQSPTHPLQATAAKAAKEGISTTSAAPAASPAPAAADKPAHDVFAGAMARAASQSTIHPLDTYKVRLQTGRMAQTSARGGLLGHGALQGRDKGGCTATGTRCLPQHQLRDHQAFTAHTQPVHPSQWPTKPAAKHLIHSVNCKRHGTQPHFVRLRPAGYSKLAAYRVQQWLLAGAAGVMAASCSAVQGSAARLQRSLGEVAQLYKVGLSRRGVIVAS